MGPGLSPRAVGWVLAAGAVLVAAETGAQSELSPAAAERVEQPREDSWRVPIAHSLALLTTLRVAEAFIWPDPFAETDLSTVGGRYREAFTRWPKWDGDQAVFEWDGDPWVLNAVGHPLLGSEVYLRARVCRRSPIEALLLTTAASTAWEYAFEASGVRPSGLDLWFTPLAGFVLGEGRYWLWQAASELRDASWRGVLTAVVDPLGELERALGAGC